MGNKCLTLFKIQLLDFLSINKMIHSKDKKERGRLKFYVVMMVFVAVIICGYSFGMAYGYAYIGMTDILPAMMMVVSSLIVFMTTFLKSNGTLFGIKDYDRIMSLPVKKSTIIISRFLSMYLLDLLFVMGVMIPTGIVYGIFGKGSLPFYLMFLLSMFTIPLFPMIIASAVGALITFISTRFKYKNAVSIILSMIAFLLIMGISFNSKNYNIEKISQISTMLMEQLYHIYPPTKWYLNALLKGNLLSFFMFNFLAIGAFVLFVYVVSLVYSNIQTALTTHKSSSNYKLATLHQGTVFLTLYRKELKRYFTCSIYVMNTLIGVIFLIGFSIALNVMSIEQLAVTLEVPEASLWAGKLIPFIGAMMISLTCTTASSISLEGKNLWILKSSPITAQTIYNSKIAVNLTLTLPAVLISGILFITGLGISGIEAVFIFVTPMVYAFFIAEVGILMNLKFPNYEWINEVTVVKQGISVLFSMMVDFVAVIIPIAVIVLFDTINTSVIVGVATLIIAFITMGLYRYTSGKEL